MRLLLAALYTSLLLLGQGVRSKRIIPATVVPSDAPAAKQSELEAEKARFESLCLELYEGKHDQNSTDLCVARLMAMPDLQQMIGEIAGNSLDLDQADISRVENLLAGLSLGTEHEKVGADLLSLLQNEKMLSDLHAIIASAPTQNDLLMAMQDNVVGEITSLQNSLLVSLLESDKLSEVEKAKMILDNANLLQKPELKEAELNPQIDALNASLLQHGDLKREVEGLVESVQLLLQELLMSKTMNVELEQLVSEKQREEVLAKVGGLKGHKLSTDQLLFDLENQQKRTAKQLN